MGGSLRGRQRHTISTHANLSFSLLDCSFMQFDNQERKSLLLPFDSAAQLSAMLKAQGNCKVKTCCFCPWRKRKNSTSSSKARDWFRNSMKLGALPQPAFILMTDTTWKLETRVRHILPLRADKRSNKCIQDVRNCSLGVKYVFTVIFMLYLLMWCCLEWNVLILDGCGGMLLLKCAVLG